MTPQELKDLIAQGEDAMRAALAAGTLSGEETATVEQALAAHAEKCPLCGHAAHTGPCPYRTADYYCDCGRPADAPIPEVIETATETKTKK